MYALVEQRLKTDMTAEEEVKRLKDLNKALLNYGFHGDYLFVLKSYEDHKRAAIYPYAGGRGEQPQWVLDDFDTVSLLEEREWLRKKHGDDMTVNDANTPPKPLPKFKKGAK